jgi:hypothetical protein
VARLDLDHLLSESYLGDLQARPLDEVRAMRADCQEVETGLSYLRRLVQGRLDIVGLELRRRAEGGDPGDLSALIAQLPETLADRTRAPGLGRLPQLLAPGERDIPSDLAAELDGIVAEGEVADLAHVPDAELRQVAGQLEEYEGRVSAQRRALFERIDALQAEITRRYKSGEASVESLLQEG